MQPVRVAVIETNTKTIQNDMHIFGATIGPTLPFWKQFYKQELRHELPGPPLDVGKCGAMNLHQILIKLSCK